MRIGIYGGSFDPIHTGHAIVANCVAQLPQLDEVWLMPARRSPLKPSEAGASQQQRIEMAEIVARDCQSVTVSDFEMHLPLPSYTADTLDALAKAYPEHQFTLIIGADNWRDFGKWRRPEEIISRYGVIIYPRPGVDICGPLPGGVTLLEDVPLAMISSTWLRRSIAKGRNVCHVTPPGVAEYITRNNLYTSHKHDNT